MRRVCGSLGTRIALYFSWYQIVSHYRCRPSRGIMRYVRKKSIKSVSFPDCSYSGIFCMPHFLITDDVKKRMQLLRKCSLRVRLMLYINIRYDNLEMIFFSFSINILTRQGFTSIKRCLCPFSLIEIQGPN